MPRAALANAELSLMELLWGHGAMTVCQIQGRLYGASGRSQHGTVERLLQCLEEKDPAGSAGSAKATLFVAGGAIRGSRP